MGNPFEIDESAFREPDETREMLPMVAPAGGAVAIGMFGAAITAQRVAVPRNLERVMANLKVLCRMNGQRYLWGWNVKKKLPSGQVVDEWIEGPTITLANDLARVYGNCVTDVHVVEAETHTMFYARFTDLETGFSMTRPFRQRRKQNIGGKYDSERAADMVFQIGASKAIRNVIVNALASYKDYMIEESKDRLFSWISANIDKAREWCAKEVENIDDLDLKRIERHVGRTIDKWTVRDLARVMTEMRGILDGMTLVEDVYPTGGDDEEPAETQTDKPAEALAKAAESGRSRRAARAKEEPKPAAETKPSEEKPAQPAEAKAAETAATIGTDFAREVADEVEHVDQETGEVTTGVAPSDDDKVQDLADAFIDELDRVADLGALEILLRGWQKNVPDNLMAAFQEIVNDKVDAKRDTLQRRAARARAAENKGGAPSEPARTPDAGNLFGDA